VIFLGIVDLKVIIDIKYDLTELRVLITPLEVRGPNTSSLFAGGW